MKLGFAEKSENSPKSDLNDREDITDTKQKLGEKKKVKIAETVN